jgi:hypothetical protein
MLTKADALHKLISLATVGKIQEMSKSGLFNDVKIYMNHGNLALEEVMLLVKNLGLIEGENK